MSSLTKKSRDIEEKQIRLRARKNYIVVGMIVLFSKFQNDLIIKMTIICVSVLRLLVYFTKSNCKSLTFLTDNVKYSIYIEV